MVLKDSIVRNDPNTWHTSVSTVHVRQLVQAYCIRQTALLEVSVRIHEAGTWLGADPRGGSRCTKSVVQTQGPSSDPVLADSQDPRPDPPSISTQFRRESGR